MTNSETIEDIKAMIQQAKLARDLGVEQVSINSFIRVSAWLLVYIQTVEEIRLEMESYSPRADYIRMNRGVR
ncbi:hypothetical protein P4V86_15580 [Brevibacillus laterosporus]|uniref:hypothetical protein n=1 Tax=Brevibacillus laterosporus TaxID=1465 RepID=UPI00036FAD04|nr:hypothetical protein [Brevibacillus laterosporus]ATO50975.1 hypothetical protein BrL25_18875 [Brevibacillus laterosporus DSM 25]MED2004767.1 hypothetical protein [Brevibacillus laterosporus]